jgi:hypothetical protein
MTTTLRVHPFPKGVQHHFEMLAPAFHTLRLVVAVALGLYMAGDLNVTDDALEFYQESWRRKITLGQGDRTKLAAWHRGAQAFFTLDLSRPIAERAQAAAIAAFIPTIPELPVDEEAWRKRLEELRHDLESMFIECT